MTIQIYDPTTEVAGRRISYAQRPESIRGLTIGLVDNTKHNSDALLLRIADKLERVRKIFPVYRISLIPLVTQEEFGHHRVVSSQSILQSIQTIRLAA